MVFPPVVGRRGIFLYLEQVLNAPAFLALLAHPFSHLSLLQIHQFELIATTQVETEKVNHSMIQIPLSSLAAAVEVVKSLVSSD